ncbi:MAG: hypothetical protein L6Q54_00260 [Leptospiraceae bacterium]|nr:hypothetical protein [Leptospiraceae bacterium]MCK6379668.1 hypothetical protein [Leptospiraceae bacterium]NUM40121.1 hypothetical protein [Leptospiraceae bacterium]
MNKSRNVFLVFFGFFVLFLGVIGGLSRIGVLQISNNFHWNDMHGPLMVSGFLGIVISLERAVALNKYWGYFSPVFSILGAVFLAFDVLSLPIASVFFAIGNLFLVGIFLYFLKIHFDRNLVFMAIGAFFFFLGNLYLIFGNSIYVAVSFWIVFLILTIVAERLELSSFLVRSKNQILLLWILLFLVGIFSFLKTGGVFFGAAILGVALWLAFNDIARRTVQKTGLARFSAFSLLIGYVWLGVSGVLFILMQDLKPGYYYDSVVHSFFLGFIMLMIFGHAPIIFPSVLGVGFVYSPIFYIHVLVMNFALVLRVYGNLTGNFSLRVFGGIGNSISIGLFLLFTMPLVLKQVLNKK